MTESQDQASAAALSAMKLPQLQAIASQVGLKGVSRLRKSDLIEAIKAHGEGKGKAQGGDAKASAEAPAKQAPAKQEPAKKAPAKQPPASQREGAKSSGRAPAKQEETPAEGSGGQDRRQERGGQRRTQREGGQQRRADSRGGQRGGGKEGKADPLDVFAEFESEGSGGNVSTLDDIQLPGAEDEDPKEGNARRPRGRDRRDRKRRPGPRESQTYEEVDVSDGDVLIPIAGVLDVLDNYAFVRTTGYLPGSSDVYVNLGMVRRYSLRRGDAITGAVRQPREGETSSRQKFNALVAPENVNNTPAAEAGERPEFDALTATYPQEFVSLGSQNHAQKVVDTLAPVALGQRVLITAESGAKRLKFFTDMAQGIAKSHPQVHLMMVLIDERPEDATHMQRNIHGEVIASSFDRSGNDHTTVATLAIDRAKRLVELGQDVIVMFDSLTALGRAFHTSTNPSSRILAHGLDASTVHSVKQLFGAGRNIENGGSLTLIATGVRGTEAGDFILSELEGVANSHIELLSGEAEPLVDPARTFTRNLEAIFDVDSLVPRIVLRRLLQERDDGATWLDEQLNGRTAEEFLTKSIKVTPREKAEIRRTLA